MIFLLDTCVVSEATKSHKHGGVTAWLASQPSERQYVSAVTIGELHYGAQKLTESRRRRALKAWIETIEQDYDGRIVPLDQAIAARWGRLRAEFPNVPVIDAQIAATAMTYGFTLVTRNVRDFAFDDLLLLNPWEE